MSKYILVKGRADYADEFYCKALLLTTPEKWKKRKKEAKKSFEEGEVGLNFGTNEELTFYNYEDWESCFTVSPISETTYNELKSILGTTYGTGDGMFEV